jgi:hypothetical protein
MPLKCDPCKKTTGAVLIRLLMASQHRRFAAVSALDTLRQTSVVDAEALQASLITTARLASANRVVERYWARQKLQQPARKPRGFEAN